MKVLQITDTHLRSDPDWELHGFNVRARYDRVLQHVRATEPLPDLILVTGDISHDEDRAVYDPVRTELESLGPQVLVIPGNHDDPDGFAEAFGQEGKVAWRFEHEAGGWHFLLLNSQIPGEVPGRLGLEQTRQLESALARAPETPTMICLHHPFEPVGTPWLDGHRIRDAGEVLRVLERHEQVRLLLCAHVHHATDIEVRAGLRQLTAPATSCPFAAGSAEFSLGDEPPGIRWLDLEPDGSFDTRVEYID